MTVVVVLIYSKILCKFIIQTNIPDFGEVIEIQECSPTGISPSIKHLFCRCCDQEIANSTST